MSRELLMEITRKQVAVALLRHGRGRHAQKILDGGDVVAVCGELLDHFHLPLDLRALLDSAAWTWRELERSETSPWQAFCAANPLPGDRAAA